MKKPMRMMTAVLLGLLAMTACKDKPKNEVKGAAIEAVERDTWHYFSFTTGAEVGTGTETAEANALWFARTDWDVAVRRYEIRTNSGAATSVGAQGGVYTFGDNVKFDAAELPAGADFVVDKVVKEEGMGSTDSIETVKSAATVVRFKTNADGGMMMPPQFLKAPVYAFKTADGLGYYKVEFTQYQNEAGESGHVCFDFEKMN